MILHELFHVVSRFPRYISCYIAENRIPLGQCTSHPAQVTCPLVSATSKVMIFKEETMDWHGVSCLHIGDNVSTARHHVYDILAHARRKTINNNLHNLFRYSTVKT